MMAIEVWTALRAHGETFFSDVVDRQIALAKELATKLAAAGDFEVALQPASNIVCYRHKPPELAGAELDTHNRQLRQRVVEDGKFYVVGIELPPRGYFLRSALMNPLTESRDLDELIVHLRALCPS
jgi:L-2,4-diaminobutyrate decarboxylase